MRAEEPRARSRPSYRPIALEMVQRIDALFDIEREINGQRAEIRKAARQDRSLPLVLGLGAWMKA